MSQALIRKGFEVPLKAWAAARSLPIAWENVNFTPPTNGDPYIRAFLMPAATTADDLQGLMRQYRGVFQVSLYMPLNRGSNQAETYAKSLDDLFPVSAPINVATVSIFVMTPMQAGPQIVTDDRMMLPVSCTYRALYAP